ARTAVDTPARLETLDVKTADLDPNAAYLLSMAQGIRPHSVRNLRRFESFHHRAQMPDDRAFPLSGEWQSGGKSPRHKASSPINHLTGYDSLRESINRGVFDVARRIEAKAAGELTEELSDELTDKTRGADE
ncbi:MAG: hypothetical protein ACOC9W_06095, partial [Persicimonas sp.]